MLNNIIDFVYPPFCICCGSLVGRDHTLVCQECFAQLTLLDPDNRCQRCFLPLPGGHHRCPPLRLKATAACFDDSQPLRSLLSSSGALLAPLILLQWHRLQWPIPDLVIPTPGDWFSKDRWTFRKEAARAVAALLNRPFDPCLGLFRHHLKVPYLSLEEQTEDAPLHAIHVRRKEAIVNAHILLLHDQTTTGHALNTSAAALKQSKAAAVYGLSIVNETLSL